MSAGSAEAGRLARVVWSRVAEPGDGAAAALTATLGHAEALDWLRTVARERPAAPEHVRLPAGVDARSGPGRRVARGALRWAPRLDGVEPARDVAAVQALGGTVLVPDDPAWPAGVTDLGAAAPHCLWVRGSADLAALTARAVAVVGARACTAYGERVAADLASGLADVGVTVVSGGAYGIDAAAHRGALAGRGPTAAFLAGGVDRAYPVGNARLLRAVVEAGGTLVSEVPPGSAPTRSRFLERNRLIAAACGATVVVEAAWRSGALSTARHATRLLRPLGAVPGPVTSTASAGCHRLLREGAAVCVTDAAEVLELLGPVRADADDPGRAMAPGPLDGLRDVERRTLEALPVRTPVPEEAVARTAGLALAEVRAALGVLELTGRAVHDVDGWRIAVEDGASRTRTTRAADKCGRPRTG